MSSWSGSGYPPPRGRSRSRSPHRGYPPPRPESGYPPADPYRGDWDTYERERAWAQYDRERAGYDYGRRPRSRSPPPDDGRKRRRSLSPWERDRYDPRPRYGEEYDTHSRGYGYPSPPHRGPYPPPPPYSSSRRAPPDPHTFDYPATLKQYAEWFRYFYPQQAAEEDNADKAAEQEAGDGSKPRNGIRSRWEKYKKDFSAQQLQRMFDHHRKSPWFAEKYDPAAEFVQMRSRVRKVGWRGRLDTFLLDLESGKFDPDDREPEPEDPPAPKEPATNTEATPAGGVDGPEGTAPASTDEQKGGDDEMQFNVEQEDEGGDTNGKQSDARRQANRGEELAVPPEGNQVMIRTIPPDIGRIKLEEACSRIPGYVCLALGDPMQKRNYYRAGWLRFIEDADMSSVITELSEKKIEGFKLHVAHITKPFTGKVRYAPEVASKPDRLVKDLVNAKALALSLEAQADALRKMKFEPKPEASEASGEANGTKEQQDVPMIMTTTTAETIEEDPEPRERGSDAVEQRIEKVMADLREQNTLDFSDEKAVEARRTVVALDLYLAYLRAAFNTCYYCAIVTDHVEELVRKCVKHVRKPLSKALLQEIKASEGPKAENATDADGENAEEKDKKEKEQATKDRSDSRDWKRNDERWLEWLDSKIALLINRDGVDPKDYLGKSYDEELSKACEQHIKQEDEGKFRCKTCQKLFKATSFVEKHIANKHPDLVKHLEDLPYYNNFALDPHHIQPFTHPPQPTGNVNQAPPPQAYGLQGPAFPMGEYPRPGPYPPGPYPPFPPPYPPNGGHWDPYAHPYMPAPFLAPRREEGVTARRLSDRLGGFAPGFEPSDLPIVPPNAGLPAKPMATLETTPGGRRNTRSGSMNGALPPPPPDAKEDPRAAAGKKVSYHDMDLVAEGDVELTY